MSKDANYNVIFTTSKAPTLGTPSLSNHSAHHPRRGTIHKGDRRFKVKPIGDLGEDERDDADHRDGNSSFRAAPPPKSGNMIMIAEPQNLDSPIHPWDLAHEVMENDDNLQVELAEPDTITPYPQALEHNNSSLDRTIEMILGQVPKCEESPHDEFWPKPPEGDFAWHLGDAYTQLRKAREVVGDPGNGNRIRVAVLDTGWDGEGHVTQPLHMSTTLDRSFIPDDKGSGNSGKDRLVTGLLRGPGHGTATMGILAGGRVQRPGFDEFYGGAPYVEMVPIRISNSVILLQTSAFYRAIDYCREIGVDVVSMSMGGVASKIWADVVNNAYEAGVTLITAAGNNFGGVTPKKLIYPSRFNRVVGVCGITADNQSPYWRRGPHIAQQGNYGPDSLMKYAMTAYSPNIPWPLIGCGDKFRMNGGGTSSATPQVAAAAALWLQHYKDREGMYQHPWQRVEAVRHALFSTADKTKEENFKFFGNGVLKAFDALQQEPVLFDAPTPADKVTFPWLRLILGVGNGFPWTRKEELYEVEMLQLASQNSDVYAQLDEQKDETTEEGAAKNDRQTMEAYLDAPEASKALKTFLGGVYSNMYDGQFFTGDGQQRESSFIPEEYRSATNPDKRESPWERFVEWLVLFWGKIIKDTNASAGDGEGSGQKNKGTKTSKQVEKKDERPTR